MILLLGLSAFTSCIDDAEFVEVDDLGAPVKEYTIATDGGSIEIPVYTNKLTSANFIGECDWAILKNSEINSDGSFLVEYDANTSYPTYVAQFIPIGPGVIWEMATISANCPSVSHP